MKCNKMGWLTVVAVNIFGVISVIGSSGIWKLVVLGLMSLLNVLFWRISKGKSGIYNSSLVDRGVHFPFEQLESVL